MQENQPQGRSLRDYVEILSRRKRVVILVVLLMPAVAFAASLRQDKLYEASTDVLLMRQNLANTLTQTPESTYDFGRVIQTQADVAESPEIAQSVARATRIPGRTEQVIHSRTTVTGQPNKDLITFDVRDPEPDVAVRLANAYASAYIAYRRDLETQAVTAARREVQAQIRAPHARGETDSRLFATLVEKSEQLRTLESLQAANAFVSSPSRSAAQVQPRTVRNIVLAVLIGLLIGIALAFLVEALETRLRHADDVADLLGVPLLGRLPAPPKGLRGGGSLVMNREPTGHRAETFRILRVNIDLATIDRDAKTIMVTSALEQEGKSTTTANLALAWALSGRRVVVVDLDLRRPSQSRMFGLDAATGVTSVALGAVSLEGALVPIELPQVGNGAANGLDQQGSLHVLPAGSPPPNVGEFVGGSRLSRILADVRDRADLVIVDSPPMLSVSDALTLSHRVDVIVAMVNLGIAKRGPVREFSRLLATAAAPTLGFVVSGAESDLSFAYGDGYYGYGTPASPPELVPAAKE
jgi:polysaccharide biosynthesis transport protein